MKIVKKVEYSKVDFVLCGTESYFPDDKKGHCCDCGKAIVYRPYHPEEVKKICVDCAQKYANHSTTN